MTRLRSLLRGEIDIEWGGFARTKGAFTDGLYGLYRLATPRSAASYIMSSGGFCAPTAPVTWNPWGEYYPNHHQRTQDLLPTFIAPRGPINFIATPCERAPDELT